MIDPRRNSQLAKLLTGPRQLVASPGNLPSPKSRTNVVGAPHNLPSMIPYGNVPPGRAQSSAFTGGVVQPQGAQAVAPPSYTAPSYGPLGPVAPAAPAPAAPAPAPPPHTLVSALLSGGSRPTSPSQPSPPTPGSTVGPSTGTIYPAGWWNPETTNTPWDPGHVTNQNQATTSGELPQRQGLAAALAAGGKRRVYAV